MGRNRHSASTAEHQGLAIGPWSTILFRIQVRNQAFRVHPRLLRILRISKSHQALVLSVIQAIAYHWSFQWQKSPTRRWKRLTIGWVKSTRHHWRVSRGPSSILGWEKRAVYSNCLPRQCWKTSNQEHRATNRIDQQVTKKIPIPCTQFCPQSTRSPPSHRLDSHKLLPASSHLYQNEKRRCPGLGPLRHVFPQLPPRLKSNLSSRTTRKSSLWNL